MAIDARGLHAQLDPVPRRIPHDHIPALWPLVESKHPTGYGPTRKHLSRGSIGHDPFRLGLGFRPRCSTQASTHAGMVSRSRAAVHGYGRPDFGLSSPHQPIHLLPILKHAQVGRIHRFFYKKGLRQLRFRTTLIRRCCLRQAVIATKTAGIQSMSETDSRKHISPSQSAQLLLIGAIGGLLVLGAIF